MLRIQRRRRAAALLFLPAVALPLAGCGEGGSSHPQSATATAGARPQRAEREFAAGQSYEQSLLPFSAAPFSAAQRAGLERRGQTDFEVRLAKAGTVSAWGQAQLGSSIARVAAAPAVTAPRPGVVSLRLHLTPRARRSLADGHSMQMYLAIVFSRSRTHRQLFVPLKGLR